MNSHPHPVLVYLQKKTQEHFSRPEIQKALKTLEAHDLELTGTENTVKAQFAAAAAMELYDALEYSLRYISEPQTKEAAKKTLERLGPLPPFGVHGANKFTP
jgi:hypothetical protein